MSRDQDESQDYPAPASGRNAGAVLDELSRRNTGGKAGRSKPPGRRAGRNNSGLLLFLVLLPVLAAAVFLAYQQYLLQLTVVDLRQANEQLNQQLSQQSVGQSEAMEALRQQLEVPTSTDLTELRNTETALVQQIEDLRRQFNQLESQQRLSNAEPDYGWKIQEAEFLARQASTRLSLDGDIASSLSLLEMADQALLQSGQGRVFSARQALADDIAALRSLEPVDREGLYQRLRGLGESLANVELPGSMREAFENRPQPSSTPLDLSGGEDLLDSSLALLNEVFVWREWEERPQAMLMAGQEAVIRQNLRLLTKQAQLALFIRDGDLYRQSLEECEALLNRYATMDSGGEALLAELNSLSQISIEQPLPSLDSSLAALQQLLATEQ